MRATLTLVFLGLLCVASFPQEVSPVIQEVRGSAAKPAKGEFSIRNLSVLPVNVTLEIHSLMLKKNGDAVLLPLDSAVVVKLSEYSFRLPAKAAHIIYFESACDRCVFSVYSSMVVGRLQNGVQVAVHLPETIYECSDTAKNCRARIRKERFGLTD